MKLVFFAPFAFSPKATVSARMLPIASALARRGHQVHILIPPYDNPEDSGRIWKTGDVPITNMSVPSNNGAGARCMLSLARQMAQHTQRLQPDLIHVFKPIGPGALAMMWLYLQGERRWVVDNDDWEGRGGWLDVNPYPALMKRVLAWQEPWALRHARVVTCASATLQQRTQELVSSSPIPAATPLFPNGPDESLRAEVIQAEQQREALRRQFGYGADPVLIYAGTVPLNHDLDIAIQAVRQALEQHPHLRWVIVASGDGLPALKASVAEAGIAHAVEYHAFMPHARLIERLVAADMALYPYRDTNINRAKCSGKVIDYMACAKPMVLSDVGMNRVYVQHGRSGLLTAPGDSASFTAALLQLLDQPHFAQLLGRAAQQRIWAQFGWDARIAELEDYYQRVSALTRAKPAGAS
jgi:glycosyltransferase involved in cell wall biosynthesis